MQPLATGDLAWAERFLDEHLGGRRQARRDELMDVLEGGAGAGIIATLEGRAAGLITWLVAADGRSAEVRALAVEPAWQGHGIGRALLDAACDALRAAEVRRAWLVTTNDNLAALALYQMAGWHLVALRPGAVEAARRTLKSAIPAAGEGGIPIRDELELERLLRP